MNLELDDKKIKTTIHDIQSTLSAMENAMNGAIANPKNSSLYKELFEKGKNRIILKVKNLMNSESNQKSEE